MSHPNPERDGRVSICGDGQCCAQCCVNSQHEHCRAQDRDYKQLACELATIVNIATDEDPGTSLSKLHKIQNDAATRMRDRCVQKLKEMRDEWEFKRNKQEPLSKMRNRYDAAFCAANEITTAIQSLTLEGERE